MEYLGTKGIETRPVFYPLHRMPPYKVDGSFRNAEYISALGLSLPSAVTLKEEQVEYVSKMIKKCLRS
jgi:perosamine synthetase